MGFNSETCETSCSCHHVDQQRRNRIGQEAVEQRRSHDELDDGRERDGTFLDVEIVSSSHDATQPRPHRHDRVGRRFDRCRWFGRLLCQ